jgi:hypothetical protein
VPTFQTTPRFDRDWKALTTAAREHFRRVIKEEFVPDLAAGRFRPQLRVKQVQSAPGTWEMTWSWNPDGRATFEYGQPQRPGERHVIWRRIGGHEVFHNP